LPILPAQEGVVPWSRPLSFSIGLDPAAGRVGIDLIFDGWSRARRL